MRARTLLAMATASAALLVAIGPAARPQPLGLRGFIVIFGQAYNDAELRVVRGLRDALARERVAHFDYTGLFDPRDLQYRLSEFDHHNSARANRIVATRLIADLGGAW